MNPFVFNTTKSILFRFGAARELGRHAGELLGAKVLLVTDPGLRRLGLAEPAIAGLRDAGHEVTVFDAVEADPSVATVMAAVDAGLGAGATGVIGFGGGSSLDVAKVTALLLGSGQPLDEAWGVNNAKGPRLPLALVPTTSGTGSEVTPVAILTIGGDEKRGVSSPILLPDIAVLDAELTLGLPPHITAATGVDAMVHAIEAYASANPNNNPLSRSLAREALRLLGQHIATAVSDGSDVAAREGMLLGSMLAGQAFANSPVAAVHALAYPVGGIFHIPHGLSNALVLTSVLRFNRPVAAAAYAEIAADAFPHLADLPEEDRAEAFVAALQDLIGRLQMPPRLRDVNIPADALPRMAADAMKQQRLLVNNPRPVTEADALAIYKEAW
ncbi:iron-containing alcohol dehydrogenase [Frigidibacter albus]|uniref:Alcohol dehydrogenase 2 n=1 Tax=Frigidibacter albus TaxID=1465486 RepID=A0A6L8VLQ2_9RHOB|nr:iron-containing alcohol dehydrogenase [Frigidibacter albus]MZQ91143.1 iron-containing alcohol dehydrogenase [Frigidibacter albus]NBE33046.1 iron-containing alcohol dehydrogenase [Frigidibacter albus]GGH63014.1 alcohol dehydrogenase [Frigidibacter albus]